MDPARKPHSSEQGGGSLNPFDDLEDDEDINKPGGGGGGGGTGDGEFDRSKYLNLPVNERPPVLQLEHHWTSMDDLIRSGHMDPFALAELRESLTAVEKLLIKDEPESSGQVGPCLKFLLSENVIESVYMFCTQQRTYAKELRIMLLKFFTNVFARSSQVILIHQQILRPISKLLRACEGVKDHDINSALIPLLHRMCILMQENQSLLDLFFIESKVHMQSKFLIFTQLIQSMHTTNEVGKRARDALLLCLSLADQLPGSNLSHFIAADSNFCQVLATGLSALYSELPNTREIAVDDWQSPIPVIKAAVPELGRFLQALDFCNSVLQMAPKVICNTVLTLVREGFLQQVMGAALLQSSEGPAMFSTAYLTIFLTHITNIALMREFLCYIMLGHCDNRPVLNTLIQNISKNNPLLCAVTLEFFYVLIDLNCEDVMLELMLRHLLAGRHIMPNQLAIVGAPDLYSQAARRFLQLLPTVCLNAEKMFLESIKRTSRSPPPTHSPTGSHSGSPPPPPIFTSTPLPSHHHLEKPTPIHGGMLKPVALSATTAVLTSGPPPPSNSINPFDVPHYAARSRSASDASTSSLVSISSTHGGGGGGGGIVSLTGGRGRIPPEHNVRSGAATTEPAFQFDYITPEESYVLNLEEARRAIQECAEKCKCWSSEYDKCDVKKEELDEEIATANRIKSLEMEDVSIKVTHEGEDDESQSSRFRSRATTLSTHSRLSRTSSERVRSRLQARRASPNKVEETSLNVEDTEYAQKTELNTVHALKRTSTITGGGNSRSPRTSPRLGRRSLNSLTKFDDNVGLFLKVLLEKLSNMLQYPPTVNMLMTRLIIRLAHYRQPLLRSFFLNHHLALRQGTPNLLSVLQTIKTTVDSYARIQEDFEKRLGRARKTMIYRAKVRNAQIERSIAQQIVFRLLRQSSRIDMGLEAPGGAESERGLKKRSSKASVLDSVKQEHSSSSQRDRVSKTDGGPGVKGLGHKGSVRRKKKKVSTDTLFAVVIFDEFLRELSAFAQEHSVINPLEYQVKHDP